MNAYQREAPHSNEELEELMLSVYGNTKRTMAPLKSSDMSCETARIAILNACC